MSYVHLMIITSLLVWSPRSPARELEDTPLARRTTRLWSTGGFSYPEPGEVTLGDRVEILGEVAGRTLRLATEARRRGEFRSARELALDTLRLITEAYLVAGATRADRRELCDRMSRLGLVTGALTLGSGIGLSGLALGSGSPAIILATVAAWSVGVPSTALAFVNGNREFKPGRRPLAVPPALATRHQRRAAGHAIRRFWGTVMLHAVSARELAGHGLVEHELCPWLSPGERQQRRETWVMDAVWAQAGDADASEFCEALLGVSGKEGLQRVNDVIE